MGSGVRHEIRNIIVGTEVGTLGVIAESKLQDGHSRESKLVADLLDFCRDNAQILGNDGQLTEFLLQCRKQLCPGTLYPAPVHRGAFRGRHFPMRFEAAKMVNADNVVEPESSPEALHPPLVTSALEQLPVKDWIAP